jgi:hypothetical protein
MQDGIVGNNLSLYASLEHIPHGSVDFSIRNAKDNVTKSQKDHKKILDPMCWQYGNTSWH